MVRDITVKITGTITFAGMEGYRASDYRLDILEEVLEDLMKEGSPEGSVVASISIEEISDDGDDEADGWGAGEIEWDETLNQWVPRK